MKTCRYCQAPLYYRNTVGACRQHQHLVRMERGDPRSPLRLKTREQLVAEGLLPPFNVLLATQRTIDMRRAGV